ncbi:MAG: NAD(P)H-dependent flavin oxidoreductase [Acidimicrobiales bacterium]
MTTEPTSVSSVPAGLHTRICDLFGIRYPVVQTGMGWVAGARLTAATSAAGGLGILAAATMTLDEMKSAIRDVAQRTDRPFGVNFRTDQPDVEDRVNFLIQAGVKVASYGQAPRRELIAKLSDAGVANVPTVGARRHAEKVAEWGVDAVIAQGAEGGGHTGSVPTSLLVPQVVDAVDIPVLAAGGYFDGRGLVAALAYGASGIAMGTRFLLTADSRVPDNVKDVYLAKGVNDTVVTKSIDGVPQRVIRTELIDRLDGAGAVRSLGRSARNALAFRRLTGTPVRDLVSQGLAMRKSQSLTLSQVMMAANAPMMTKAALVDGRPETGVLPTGQVLGVVEELPTVAELVARIMAEATDTLVRLGVGHSGSASPTTPGSMKL